MDTERVLSEFAGTRRKAVLEYRRFVQEGVDQSTVKELTGGGLIRSQGGWSQVMSMRRRGQKEDFDQRILGGGEFVNQILKESEDRQIRQLKCSRAGQTIQRIIAEECRKTEIDPRELQGGSKRRNVSGTRARIAARCREELGLSAAAIARHLGVSTPAITKALERMEKEDLI